MTFSLWLTFPVCAENLKVFRAYTYDLATMPAGTGARGCLTAKKGAYGRVVFPQWGAVFFYFFHFLLFFVTFYTARNFYKFLFTAETWVKFVTFFTVCNFHKLLFTVEKGQGLYFIHCARGKGCTLIFFLLFFYC